MQRSKEQIGVEKQKIAENHPASRPKSLTIHRTTKTQDYIRSLV